MPDGSLVGTTKLAQRMGLRGQFTDCGWEPPSNMSLEEWRDAGMVLSQFERVAQWWIGDWWAFGEYRYGDRKAIVTASDWTGPSYQTCANAASVCRAFPTYRRREVLSFKHHAEVAALAPKTADALLDQAVHVAREQGKPPPSRELRQAAKRNRRAAREEALADATV